MILCVQYLFVCACMCDERERERAWKTEGQIEREREGGWGREQGRKHTEGPHDGVYVRLSDVSLCHNLNTHSAICMSQKSSQVKPCEFAKSTSTNCYVAYARARGDACV